MNDGIVDLAYLCTLSDPFEQGDGEFSADMFLELTEPPKNFEAAIRSLEVEDTMPGRELQPVEQIENTPAGLFAQQADLGGIA